MEKEKLYKWISKKARKKKISPELFNPDVYWGKYITLKEIKDSFIHCFCDEFEEGRMLPGWEKYHTKISKTKSLQHFCYDCEAGQNALNFYNSIFY